MPPQKLIDLVGDLDFDQLRIRRPTKVIFFCGGTIPVPPNPTKSLRAYLLDERKIESKIGGQIVLAERATQLFRDTKYSDLITFEEDIARIAALVMLIAESPGSLAELGAFATNDTIRRNLLVLGRTAHSNDDSFIRHGPMKKVRNDDSRRLAFYPWRLNANGHIIKSSISGHFARIKKLVNDQLSRIPFEQHYRGDTELARFAQVLWMLHICTAIETEKLSDYLASGFLVNSGIDDVVNKLYCMKLAGWVDSYQYENRIYWYSLSVDDPFKYKFKAGVPTRDSVRRKAEVMAAARVDLRIPRHVLTHVTTIKSASA